MKRLFKNIQDNVSISLYQFTLIDTVFPVGTYVYTDRKNRIAYLCTRFPRSYHGMPSRVILNVTWYDFDTHFLGSTTLQNCKESLALFKAFQSNNGLNAGRVVREFSDSDYENFMRHERRHKRGTGGVILGKNCGQTTDNLHYKQVTESAYWANLDNMKSGNASVVASSIR